MFKKLFDALMGSEDEKSEKKTDANQSQQAQNNYDEAETEDDYEADADEVDFDPETLHGTHYDVSDFNAEVEKRVKAWVASEEADGEKLQNKDIENFRFNYRREVYMEWNRITDYDQVARWENANSLEFSGYANSANAHKVDMSGPMFEPIHGIDLSTYAGMVIKMSNGVSDVDVLKAMNIEPPVWQEINDAWTKRMAEDNSFSISVAYGAFFSNPPVVPQLENLKAASNLSPAGAANLEKMKGDKYYYAELEGARQAAYDYGMDGAQYILDTFGIGLGDFQTVAMHHMTESQKIWNSTEMVEFENYKSGKQKEYAAKFASEQGGNVADDVEF
jgi:hypothetical protein